MTSSSRTAQEALTGLEKAAAPYNDQLVEATKFLGLNIDTIHQAFQDLSDTEPEAAGITYYGKEEWLLRWLLKKLQAPDDDTPRKNVASWQILLHCIRKIPLPIVARILIERKFISILQETLEDAKEFKTSTEKDADSISKQQDETSSKSSKKRKRSGQLIESRPNTDHGLRALLKSIHSVINILVYSTQPGFAQSTDGRGAAFSVECMKSVIRTNPGDAAKVFGLWLTLLERPSVRQDDDTISWLSPFIEIWDCRATHENELVNFSIHCSLPLLLLANSEVRSEAIETQTAELIARNIIIPAKSAYTENSSSTLLKDLTTLPVVQNSWNAASIFDVAIRLIQPQGSKRRRSNDESWLQTVFNTLKEAMPTKKVDSNSDAICAMIRSAIEYKVDLKLEVLQSITAEYALLKDSSAEWELKNWELVYTIIKLDANVFLIPHDEHDLLQILFARINRASLQPKWSERVFSRAVISKSLVPLMNAFAKARDLSGFVHHWYHELVKHEQARKYADSVAVDFYGPWEDEVLQDELQKLLEPSLTTQQINQLLDWLEVEVRESPGPACVVLEAISNNISLDEVIDAIGMRVFHVMFDTDVSDKLDERYMWRSWRLLSRVILCLSPLNLDELTEAWQTKARPFQTLTDESNIVSVMERPRRHNLGLEYLHRFRVVCAAFSTAKSGSKLEEVTQPLLLTLLQTMDIDTVHFWQTNKTRTGLEVGWDDLQQNTVQRNETWIMLSFVRCILVEFPKVLISASRLDDQFRGTLVTIFWLCSAGSASGSFAPLWVLAMNCDEVLNDQLLTEMMIDIMLENKTHSRNPLTESNGNNDFAVSCLLQLPIGLLHKKHREQLLRGWLPHPGGISENTKTYDSTALDPAVLALKVKIMQQPMLYEDMVFEELVHLGDSLAGSSIERAHVNLVLYKELAKLTLEFVFANHDQRRCQEYIEHALSYVRKKLKKIAERPKHEPSYAAISLYEVVLGVFEAKMSMLNEHGIITEPDLRMLTSSYRESLCRLLKNVLKTLSKESIEGSETGNISRDLLILSISGALATLGFDKVNQKVFSTAATIFLGRPRESELDVQGLLHAFMAVHTQRLAKEPSEIFKGDIATVYGRESIVEMCRAATDGAGEQKKLVLLKAALLSVQDFFQLDRLFAIRQIIQTMNDLRKTKLGEDGIHGNDDDENDDSDEEDEQFDLSAAYSILCNSLWKTRGKRQFCLISEIMELILRTKARTMTQWNIDSTLGSISIICSRHGPSISTNSSSTIFLHMCHLLQAVLTSHRLKLEGHFHLVVQALQVLLRCLFTPLPYSSAKTLKVYAPPPWLSSDPTRLGAKHAAAYTRLITLICDPSVSSVTRSKHNNLTSATDKAKRMAGQHMRFVLATYIKLQLEMQMLPDIREKMVPGLYAIFDTTTPELRRCISDSLNSSGRAVFGTLYKDYLKFGKWIGS